MRPLFRFQVEIGRDGIGQGTLSYATVSVASADHRLAYSVKTKSFAFALV